MDKLWIANACQAAGSMESLYSVGLFHAGGENDATFAITKRPFFGQYPNTIVFSSTEHHW